MERDPALSREIQAGFLPKAMRNGKRSPYRWPFLLKRLQREES